MLFLQICYGFFLHIINEVTGVIIWSISWNKEDKNWEWKKSLEIDIILWYVFGKIVYNNLEGRCTKPANLEKAFRESQNICVSFHCI